MGGESLSTRNREQSGQPLQETWLQNVNEKKRGPTRFNYSTIASFPGTRSAWLASCPWHIRVPAPRNGNQQQGKCQLFDLAPETASWRSRPCNRRGHKGVTY